MVKVNTREESSGSGTSASSKKATPASDLRPCAAMPVKPRGGCGRFLRSVILASPPSRSTRYLFTCAACCTAGASSTTGTWISGAASCAGRLPLEPAKDLRYLYWRLTAAAERLPGSIAAMSAKGMEMEEASMMSLFSSGRKPFLVGTSDALSRDTVRGPLRGRYDSSSRSSSSCLPKSSRAACACSSVSQYGTRLSAGRGSRSWAGRIPPP
mmetsp:Transcript_45323/g.114776  ORF Transcript_45323/g.114776 Transcript_45323/m.114776 type:complete len:212 (+) Transcript_45323:169-804(+)